MRCSASSRAPVTGEVTIELRRGDDYTILETRGEAHLRPGAAEHGAERDGVHRRRSHRPARCCRTTTSPTRARFLEKHGHPLLDGAGMTLWAASTGVALDPDVDAFLRADDDELLPYDCAATARPRAAPPRGRHPRRRASSPRSRRDSRRSRTRGRVPGRVRGRALGDRGAARPVGRKIHAGRSRNDQVAAAVRLYVEDASAEASSAVARLIRDDPRRRRARGGDAAAGLHAPAACAAGDVRPPPARVGGDARARLDALRGRGGARRRRARSAPGALAGSTLALPLPAYADAQLARRRRRPRLRARLPVRGRRAVHAPLAHRRGDRPLVHDASSASCRLPRVRVDRLVDDAAEAQPRRRRARARQGRHRDRPAHRPARRREGPAARVRQGPAGGQDAALPDAPRCPRGARGAQRPDRRISSSTTNGSPPR